MVEEGTRPEIGPACRGKIALVGVVGPFLEIDPLDQFRDHEVQIGIALPVGVRNHVDGHTIQGKPDIGAVVEIETPQKQLFGLATSRVLPDKQTRDEPKHFLRVGDGPQFDIEVADQRLIVGAGGSHHHLG